MAGNTRLGNGTGRASWQESQQGEKSVAPAGAPSRGGPLCAGTFALLLAAVIATLAGCGAEESPPSRARLALAAGKVQGLVRDDQGAPVGGARVEFRVPATGNLVASPTSDPDGAFAADLADGIYDVVVLPTALFLAQTFPGQIVVGQTQFTFVLVRANETVSGHVRGPKGQPLAGQAVCFEHCGAAEGCLRVCGTSDANGRYSVNVSPGTYRLLVEHQPFSSEIPRYFLNGPEVVVPPEGLVRDVTIRNHVLRGQVINGSGPVEGAAVHIAGGASYACYPVQGPEWNGYGCAWTTMTDSEGRFAFPVIESAFALEISAGDTTAVPVVIPVDDEDPPELVVATGATPRLRGRIENPSGTGLADQEVCLEVCSWTEAIGCTAVCDATDADGRYGLDVPAGRHRFGVEHPWFGLAIPYYAVSGPELDLSASATAMQNVTVPIRRLTVQVREADDQPARAARVYIDSPTSTSCYNVTFAEMSGPSCLLPGRTDDEGVLQMPMIEGSFKLQVAGARTTATVDVTVAGDTIVAVKLPVQAALSGLVVGGSGAPLPDQTVCVSRCDAVACSNVCVQSDADGRYAINTPPGTYTLSANQPFMSATVPHYSLSGAEVVVTEAPTTRNIRVPVYLVGGQVVDVDGQPAASTVVGVETVPGRYGCYNVTVDDLQGYACVLSQTADTGGRFQIPLLAPLVPAIQVAPSSTSGLATFTVRDLVVQGDVSLVVAVQFLQESVFVSANDWSAEHPATTDSEGDGATYADPVETTVLTPWAGNVKIEEVPITEKAPPGYSFLTQQVNITADPGGTGNPLRITFRIDCSRFPPPQECGENLEVAKDGVRVEGCTPSRLESGEACVFNRSLVGDDVQIIVYTETASAWNFAVPLPPDSDGDGIRDTADACPDQPEDLDGVNDGDGCPDPDPQPVVDAGTTIDAAPAPEGGTPAPDGGAPAPDGGTAADGGAPPVDAGSERPSAPDADPDPPHTRCADFDDDGRVTGRDLQIIRRYLRENRHQGDSRELDVNLDGRVDARDVDATEQQLGRRCRARCRHPGCDRDHCRAPACSGHRCDSPHDDDHHHHTQPHSSGVDSHHRWPD